MEKYIIENSFKAYREIEQGKNRVTYGKLAGKYCEAAANLFLAEQYQGMQNAKKAIEHFEKCTLILEECLDAEKVFDVRLATLEKCKIFRAFQLMFEDQVHLSVDSSRFIEQSKGYEKQFNEAKDTLIKEGMSDKVLQNRNWIFTPIN